MLYGLIHYIHYNHTNKHNITAKSTHIKNDIISLTTGIKNTRYYNVTNLTKYICKRYITSRDTIIEKYRLITDSNSPYGAVGSSLDEFLS